MRFRLRTLCFASLALLLAGALLLSWRLSAAVQPFVAAEIEKAFGAPASLGRASLGVFPPALVIDDLAVPPHISVSRVRFNVSPASVVAGELVLTVDIEKPVLRGSRSREGVLSWQAVQDRFLSYLRVPPPIPMRVAKVSIRAAQADLLDEWTGARVRIDGLASSIDLGQGGNADEASATIGAPSVRVDFSDGRTISGRGETALRVAGRDVVIKKVSAVVDGMDVSAGGKASLSPEGAVDIAGRARGPIEKALILAGRTEDGGGLFELEGKITGTVAAPLGRGRLTVTEGRIGPVRVERFSGEISASRNGLSVGRGEASLFGGRARGTAEIAWPDGRVRYAAEVDFASLRTEQIGALVRRLRSGAPVVPGMVSGRVDIKGGGGEPWPREGSMDVEFLGEKGSALFPRSPAVRKARAAVRLPREGAGSVSAEAETEGGRIDVKGQVARSGEIDLLGSVAVDDVGPWFAGFAPRPAAGPARAEMKLGGRIDSPSLSMTVKAGPGRYASVPVSSVEGRARWEEGRLTFDDMTVLMPSRRPGGGDGRFDLKGSIVGIKPGGLGLDPVRFDLLLTVAQGDPRSVTAMFHRDLPIELAADGSFRLTGTPSALAGRGTLRSGPGEAYGQSFSAAQAVFSLTNRDIRFDRATARLNGGQAEGSGWIGFDGSYEADLKLASLPVLKISFLQGFEPAGARMEGALGGWIRGKGTFADPGIDAEIVSSGLRLGGRVFGPLRTRLSTEGRSIVLRADLDEPSIHAEASLSLRAPRNFRARAALENVQPLAYFGPGWQEKGVVRLSGAGQIQGDLDDPRLLRGEVRLHAVEASIGDFRVLNQGNVVFSIRERAVTVAQAEFAGPSTSFNVRGRWEVWGAVDLGLEGHADLRFLKVLTSEVEDASGTASFSARFSGEASSPAVRGSVRAAGGSLRLKSIPQRVSSLGGEIHFAPGRVLLEGLKGEVGGGTIAVDGSVPLAGLKPASFAVVARARGVTIRPWGEAAVKSNADLVLGGAAARLLLSGEVRLVSGRYRERFDWKTKLADLRRRAERPRTEAGWLGKADLAVRVVGRENLWIDNNVLRAPVTVDLGLSGTAARPGLVGRVEAREGTILFRSREFKILNAAVEFVDPRRIQPVMDVRAEARIQSYVVEMSLMGTLDRFSLALNSSPPLSEFDILSLLTVGQVPKALAGRETGVAAGEAVSFLTGRLQDVVEERVRRIAGIDRFQIDPYATTSSLAGAPRVTVGKRLLGDRLYVTYSASIGTSEEQIIQLEYRLTDQIYLVGDRDETGQVGGDIRFRFRFK